jgi:hypothetical protein
MFYKYMYYRSSTSDPTRIQGFKYGTSKLESAETAERVQLNCAVQCSGLPAGGFPKHISVKLPWAPPLLENACQCRHPEPQLAPDYLAWQPFLEQLPWSQDGGSFISRVARLFSTDVWFGTNLSWVRSKEDHRCSPDGLAVWTAGSILGNGVEARISVASPRYILNFVGTGSTGVQYNMVSQPLNRPRGRTFELRDSAKIPAVTRYNSGQNFRCRT